MTFSIAVPTVDTPDYPEGNTPPPGGQSQAYRQNLSSLMPKAEDGEPLLLLFDLNGVNLTAGNSITFYSDGGVPEFWRVAIRPVAGVKVSCYNGPEASGIPMRLGGGGTLKVQAKSEYFTVVAEAGSPGVVGTVAAMRNMEFEINGGAV